MKAIIVGGGRIGSHLAEILVREGWEVIIIEKDRENAEKLSKEIDALVLNIDALDRRAIKEIDFSGVDVVIAATGDDKTNILICEVMKRHGVQRAIARVIDPENYDIFLSFDIHPINESSIIVDAMLRSIYTPHREKVVATINDGASIVRYIVDAKSPLLNKRVKETSLGRQIFCIGRNGDIIIPDERTTIRDGDVIYIVVSNEDLHKVRAMVEE